ncbi:MAG TPA: type II secretion system protein GspG, partial [bacterium]|nr:type II secretion system protein GspG [bacterium]
MFKKFFKALLEERAGVAVKGFSLLEIMVVITIMTMIMGAVGVGVMSYLDKSKIKQARIDIATISNALDLYKTEFGKYPDSEDGLSRLVEEKILKEKKAP